MDALDEVDVRIMRILHANGRASQEQVARAVHLSRPAVHERIKRLEERGVIRGYRACVEWAAIGLPVTAFIWVRTAGGPCMATATTVCALGDCSALVEEGHRVTGDWCLLLKVRAASPLALQDLLDRVRAVSGVHSTMTTVALSTVEEKGAPSGRGGCGLSDAG